MDFITGSGGGDYSSEKATNTLTPLCSHPGKSGDALRLYSPYIFSMFTDLYNGEILSLASQLENARLDAPDGTARKVSKLCGSWLEIDLNIVGERVSDCALRVQACALGQASAAILKEAIIGATLEDLTAARDSLRAMLKAGAVAPLGRFAKLALLSGVGSYPARHASTLLAFEAAVAAFEGAEAKAT